MSVPATGRVVQVDAKVVHVEVDGRGRDTLQAALRGSLFEDLEGRKNPVAVGDRVELDLSSEPAAVERVLERRNYLGRIASSHDPREQVLVANVDRLLCIGSVVKPGFSSNRTDRILAACHWHEIPTVLVLNKADLAKPGRVDELRATYEAIPIEVLVTSAKTGEGIERFAEFLKDGTTVLYGPSGAGKSTLVNRVQPDLNLREGRISSYWQQGRHTTTHSRLHHLDLGGAVIDTPGIRVFRVHGLRRQDVRDLFPDFERFQSKCAYTMCSHDHEPDCAVADAAESGELAATRYASYIEMLDEADPDGAYEGVDEAPPGNEVHGDA